jgi:prevent-host-death family protein
MLQVDIEKIIPVTEARDSFNKIVDEVEGTDEMYVLTKNGKPSAVVVGVNHLEKLTGAEGAEVMAKIGDMNEATPDISASTAPAADYSQAPASDAFSEPAPAVEQPVQTAPQTPAVEPMNDFSAPVEAAPAPAEPTPAGPEPVLPNLPPVEPAVAPAPDPFATPAATAMPAVGEVAPAPYSQPQNPADSAGVAGQNPTTQNQ